MPSESSEPAGPLTVERRRAAFAALVKAQDSGQSVADSRSAVGSQFQLTESQMKAVEREGVERGWPPL